MKIDEYGLLFEPMFFKTEPFLTLVACAKHMLDNRTSAHQDYQLGIKVIWNGKASSYLHLKIVQNLVYIKLREVGRHDHIQDPLFLDKLLESLPPMQDYGNVQMGVLNI